MSEASSDFRPQPALPAWPLRRARRSEHGDHGFEGSPRGHPAHGSSAERRRPEAREPEDGYPLDPPLVDVRIPVKAPHATATAYSRNALMHRFPDAEVGDDLHMLFTTPGERKRSRLSPDVLVALTVPRDATRSDYDADQLGPPDFVLEVVSKSTWKHDVGRKLESYQRIGVRECLLFDVAGEDWAGTGKELWGFALTPEGRAPLREGLLPNGERGVFSAVLGLWAYISERTPPSSARNTWALAMRWHDPATGDDIPDYEQSRRNEARERTRAEAAERAAEAAQRRVAELEERLRRRNGI